MAIISIENYTTRKTTNASYRNIDVQISQLTTFKNMSLVSDNIEIEITDKEFLTMMKIYTPTIIIPRFITLNLIHSTPTEIDKEFEKHKKVFETELDSYIKAISAAIDERYAIKEKEYLEMISKFTKDKAKVNSWS